jgi:hypothetical protein
MMIDGPFLISLLVLSHSLGDVIWLSSMPCHGIMNHSLGEMDVDTVS